MKNYISFLFIFLVVGLYSQSQQQLLVNSTVSTASNQTPFLHYDAEDVDGDGNPGNNPTDGSNITTWYDISGNNHNLTASSGKEPTYSTTQLNGYDGIAFSSSSDALSTGALSELDGVTSYTIFCVYHNITTYPASYVWNQAVSASSYMAAQWVYTSNIRAAKRNCSGQFDNIAISGSYGGTSLLTQYIWDNDNYSLKIRNGGSNYTGSSTYTNCSSNHVNFIVGAYNTGGSGGLGGRIYELLVFTPKLSAEDETYWWDLLQTKYNL